MHISVDGHGYEWIESWARIPETAARQAAWAHDCVAVCRDGTVVGISPDDGRIIIFEPAGQVLRELDFGIVEGHGLAISTEGDKEYLWIADCGLKMVHTPGSEFGYEKWVPRSAGRAIKVDLSKDSVVRELPTPQHLLYEEGADYLPTSIAPAPNGEVWVADGYGASLLHRFSPEGQLLTTLTGEESEAGRFDCPHGILIDTRKDEPELYLTDRMNRRLLVFDVEGAFRRQVGRDFLALPSVLAVSGDVLLVGDLGARLSLLDRDDQLIGHLGDNEPVLKAPGWPNSFVDGKFVRPGLEEGKFNSPHGLAVDPDGNVYVSEFLIGGRHIKLAAEASPVDDN